MQRHDFQRRIKRVTHPAPSHLITIPHLPELYNRNLDGSFELFFKTEVAAMSLDGQAIKYTM